MVNPTQITCTFDLTGKAIGLWNVVVANPDSLSGFLMNGFCVALSGSAPTVGTTNRAIMDPIITDAAEHFRFTLWGRVTTIDSDSFWLDDGSQLPVKVIAAGYSGIADGDYVSACGTLDVSASPVVLISSAVDIEKHN